MKRRTRLVRKNFQKHHPKYGKVQGAGLNRRFNSTINSSDKFEPSCRTALMTGRDSIIPGAYPEGEAIQLCKCIKRKQYSCTNGGWNMSPAGARRLCGAVFNGTTYGPTPVAKTPVPGNPYKDPVTPCYNDKGYVKACPNGDNPNPDYPSAYPGDPTTPCYNDKGQVVSCEPTGGPVKIAD